MKQKTEQFISIPIRVLDSDSYRNLSPIARDILTLSLKHFRPYDSSNTFTLSYNQICDHYHFSRRKIKPALDELIKNQFFFVENKEYKHSTIYKHNVGLLKIQ